MVEMTCGRCGGTFPYQPSPEAGGTLSCPHCAAAPGDPVPSAADLEADGAETIMVPEYRPRSQPAAPLDGTNLLGSKEVAESPSHATVTLRGFLTQEGKPSGEGDYRLPSETTVVGRERGAIRVDDSAISARHFEVEERGSEFFLRDLESRNGTLLNGHPVRSAKLKSGDRIVAGNTTFSFSVRHVIPV